MAITAVVVRVNHGGFTTANLGSKKDLKDRDTIIELALEKNALANQWVIAYVTPRFRAAKKEKGVDWTTEALRDPNKGILGKRVEVTGWLLFNFVHANEAENTNPGNPTNKRATCWEIHPVTDIRVLD